MKWEVGQVWKTQHAHKFRVIHVHENGLAVLVMIAPFDAPPVTQKNIPPFWRLTGSALSAEEREE